MLGRWGDRSTDAATWDSVLQISNVPTRDLELYGGVPFSVGDSVRNENGTVLLGRVVSVEQRPIEDWVLRDGKLLREISSEKVTLLVGMRSEGSLRAGSGVRIGSIRLAAGMSGYFRIGRFSAGATVLSLREAA